MSLLSLVGFVLFVILCYGIKGAIQPCLAQKSYIGIDKDGKQIEVPACPPNYILLIKTAFMGLIFLVFVIVATVNLWDVGPKISL